MSQALAACLSEAFENQLKEKEVSFKKMLSRAERERERERDAHEFEIKASLSCIAL